MQYDFYNRDNLYKPPLATACRDRLHDRLFRGLGIASILEVGVGFGELADYCHRRNIGWTGIDSNERLAAELEGRGHRVYRATMPDFPRVEEPFDAIVASHFIEHLADYREALRFLSACRERLAAGGGGTLVLLFPDIERIGHFFWQDYTHSFVTTKKRIEDMLGDTGFELVRSGRYTACFFAASRLVSAVGKVFPYFLLSEKLALFARLSFQQHAFALARTGPPGG